LASARCGDKHSGAVYWYYQDLHQPKLFFRRFRSDKKRSLTASTDRVRSDRLHLEAAQGWLGLGNWREANDELDQITPVLRAHADVLKVRWEVCAQANQWELGFEIASALAAKGSRESFGVIHAAYALRQLDRTQAAHDLLSGVIEQFPKDQAIRYDLACYCCQLGKLKEAMDHLERAIDLAGNDIRHRTLDDLALEPLWANIGEI
jgi:tetratricopeptide (TPR) repeat protein